MRELNMNPGRLVCSIETTWMHRFSFTVTTSSLWRVGGTPKTEKHLRSKWDVEVQTFGPGDDDGMQVLFFNRILTWGPNGIGYEADQKHAAMFVKENLTSKDRLVSTPEEDTNDTVNEPELSEPEEIMSFRADAARDNYLSMDRPDLQFSAEEISRAQAKANEEGPAQNRENGEIIEGS